MKILIFTDAWHPQVNGVVRTLEMVLQEIVAMGHEVRVISPDLFNTIPCPTYPEIRLAFFPGRKISRLIADFAPDAVHISTEGPIGIAARQVCVRGSVPFTTSYHTRFPEYISARLPVPLSIGYKFMRWFHGASQGVMTATDSLRWSLERRGFRNLKTWTRGVDLTLFKPLTGNDPGVFDLPRPLYLYVGRVAVEKNIGAFLDMSIDAGTKIVVGDGPQLKELRRRHPDVVFTGEKHGEELARHYASADVFVFPSRTDTFGLVLLEALACGTAVAAYPVTGPIDVISGSDAGSLDEDLSLAAAAALHIPKGNCRKHAETFSWNACARQFVNNLTQPVTP